MKKIVFSALLGMIMGLSPVIAQDAKPAKDSTRTHKHGDHAAHRMEMLKKDLNLSEEQATKVKAAFQAHHQKMKAGKDLGDAEKKSLRKTSKAELDTQLKSILSADQYTKFQTKIAERKKHKGKKRHCSKKHKK